MSKIANVVDGEASESESEIEIAETPNLHVSPGPEPFVIAGEAPESDDESHISSPHPVEPGAPPSPSSPQRNLMQTNFNSLLHQKLWECNVGLRAALEGLLRHSADIAAEKLTRSDRTLLTVQESMRSTSANLTLARARLKQIHAGLDRANCAAALPGVRLGLKRRDIIVSGEQLNRGLPECI